MEGAKEIIILLSELNHRLGHIHKLLRLSKKVKTTEEAAEYLGISICTLYHYVSDCLITHYKPNGKKDYFLEEDLLAFALQNKIESLRDITQTSLSKSLNF